MFFFLTVGVFLLLFEIFYIRIADKLNIIDKPNERSLHSTIIVRGGGIIFFIASTIFFVFNNFEYPYFYLGLALIAGISFIDDIITLSNKYRILIHILSISLIFIEINMFQTLPWWLILICWFICIGIVNAYNFMDGVNGITGAYSLVALLSLTYINNSFYFFIDDDFLIIIIISALVFLLFNFRKKAVCFGGDIGSISIAFILIFLIFRLIYESNDWKFIFFLTFYGLDTVYTIFYRLLIRQNIFKAHKLHFFQLLVYQNGFSHLQVATIYALGQLLFNIWVIKQSATNPLFYLPIFSLLGFMHLVRKKQGLAITIK